MSKNIMYRYTVYVQIYRVIQGESSIFSEVIGSAIVRKNFV
jgi:predicted CopG family antitoxin